MNAPKFPARHWATFLHISDDDPVFKRARSIERMRLQIRDLEIEVGYADGALLAESARRWTHEQIAEAKALAAQFPLRANRKQ